MNFLEVSIALFFVIIGSVDSCIYTTTYPSNAPADLPRPTTTSKSTLQGGDFIAKKIVNWNGPAVNTIALADVQLHTDAAELIYQPTPFSSVAHGVKFDASTWIIEAGRLMHLFVSLNQSAGSPVTHFGLQWGVGEINYWKADFGATPDAIYRGVGFDGLEVYETRTRIPIDVCAQGSTTARSCVVIPLKTYAMWFVGADDDLQAHAFGPYEYTDLPLHCGSLCYAEPGTACVHENFCQTGCTSFGYKSDPTNDSERNRQITRRYDVGLTTGTITLNYTTGATKDRIIAYYENLSIFNSGCVATGAGVWQTGTLRYGGITTEIRIDVEPNCDADGPSRLETDFEYKFPQQAAGIPTTGPCTN